jgi:Carboxypeptidase regulatory-like domain
MKAMRVVITVLILALCQSVTCPAVVSARGQSSERLSGSGLGAITGTVRTDSGKPLSNIRVVIREVNSRAAAHTTRTGPDGQFAVEDLTDGNYSVVASAPGYFRERPPADKDTVNIYHPGDSINLVLTLGGVITGAIRSADGAPVVGVEVQAVKVLEVDNRVVADPFTLARRSDDRGVYRIFGLVPGTYLVRAGGSSRVGVDYRQNRTVTYYPSETAATALKVQVSAGAEASGINITLHDDPGHTLSGKVLIGSGPANAAQISIWLYSNEGVPVYTGLTQLHDDGFAIYGIPNGSFKLYFLSHASPSSYFAVKPITVNGADVKDLKISLSALGWAKGRIQIKPGPKPLPQSCQQADIPLQSLRIRAAQDEEALDPFNSSLMSAPSSLVTAGGDFQIANLKESLYRLEVGLPRDDLYVESITVRNKPIIPEEGFLVRPGEAVDPILVTLGRTAATLRGRIDSEGAPAAPAVSLWLIPAEENHPDELLSLTRTPVSSDGTFNLTHIPPGKYYVIAKSQPGLSGSKANHLDDEGRRRLRREAETQKNLIDLKPCSEVVDFIVPYRHS